MKIWKFIMQRGTICLFKNEQGKHVALSIHLRKQDWPFDAIQFKCRLRPSSSELFDKTIPTTDAKNDYDLSTFLHILQDQENIDGVHHETVAWTYLLEDNGNYMFLTPEERIVEVPVDTTIARLPCNRIVWYDKNEIIGTVFTKETFSTDFDTVAGNNVMRTSLKELFTSQRVYSLADAIEATRREKINERKWGVPLSTFLLEVESELDYEETKKPAD